MKLKFKEYIGKPDKQRLISAIIGEPVDRVPNFEILYEDKVLEKVLGRYVGGSTLGSMNEDAISKDALDKAQKVHKDVEIEEEGRPIYAKDYVEFCEIVGQDAIGIGDVLAPFFKVNNDGKKILVKDKSFKNREDVKNRLILPTENIDYFKRLLPYIYEYREEASRKNMGFTMLVGDLFQQLYEYVFDIQNFSLLLYDDYQLIEELMEAGIEYWVNFSKFISREKLVDFIYFADDVAFKSGLFINPEIFKKLWIDKYRRVIEPFKNAAIPVIFHSDGKVYEIIEELIEMGIDCLNPLECYSMDYKLVKKRYGRNLTIMGNIDLVFPLATGTPGDVKKDVWEHMEVCKPGYRYICATSHDVTNYIPDNNLIAFIDSIHEYGVY
jgi:uroporphyrinogen-III decarboxylase